MDNPNAEQPPCREAPPQPGFDVRFWERGRLIYNAAQLALTAIMVPIKWPESQWLFTADRLGGYLGAAIIANILYCAAYLVELMLQWRALRPYAAWVRQVVLLLGTLLALILAGVGLIELFTDPSLEQ